MGLIRLACGSAGSCLSRLTPSPACLTRGRAACWQYTGWPRSASLPGEGWLCDGQLPAQAMSVPAGSQLNLSPAPLIVKQPSCSLGSLMGMTEMLTENSAANHPMLIIAHNCSEMRLFCMWSVLYFLKHLWRIAASTNRRD